VDILDGKAVRLLRGDYDRIEVDAGDPLAQVRRAARSAPRFVHVVALGAARDGGVPIELAERVVSAASPVSVQFGGGVRSPADAEALRRAGIARVVVGTAAFGARPLTEFVEALGDRLAVAVDVAGGVVRTAGWRASAQLRTEAALSRCADAGVETVVCTAIERDGTRAGPDLGLLTEVRGRFAGRVIAAGGIRDAADLEALRRLGLDGVVVGRAWLDGTLRLEPGGRASSALPPVRPAA
jgi:phosphoribosylformimino-5-aminoimidazole carboxamide ribotide isomerase